MTGGSLAEIIITPDDYIEFLDEESEEYYEENTRKRWVYLNGREI